MRAGGLKEIMEDLLIHVRFPTTLASIISNYTFDDTFESLHFHRGLHLYMDKEGLKPVIESGSIRDVISYAVGRGNTQDLLITYYNFRCNLPRQYGEDMIEMVQIKEYLMDRYDPYGDAMKLVKGSKDEVRSWPSGGVTRFTFHMIESSEESYRLEEISRAEKKE